MKKITRFLILILVVMIIIKSCKPDKIVTLPTVVTGVVSSIHKTSANLSGSVTSTGGASTISRGFYLSSFHSSDEIRIDCGSGEGSFNHSLSDLEPNLAYYVRAF